MQDAYLFAFCLRPPSILGRPMKPFSSAHLMALDCIGSPLLHAIPVSPADLLAAIYVCSFEWPFPWFEKGPAALKTECQQWGATVPSGWDFAATLAQWRDYFESYWKAPERDRKPGSENAPNRAPAAIRIVAWLLRTIHGMTETRAWNMPICLALAYKAGCDAFDGDDSLLDDDAIAFLDASPESNGTGQDDRSGVQMPLEVSAGGVSP